MSHLLVIDDEASICWGLSKLARQMGHTVESAASAEQGLDVARRQPPDALVMDVRLPGLDGLAAMERFRHILGPLPIIIITAYGDLATAVQAVRNGAFDYLLKPFELEAAQRAIGRALAEATRPPPPTPPTVDAQPAEGTIVGRSPAIQEVFKRIAVVAPSEACVHLTGQSGTGKELVARAIHRYSRRAAGPFVAVNLAALSPTLAESELFGHVRGAFTGADAARKGLLEQSHGGTVFFDEVADIPLPLQVKLLRVLEHGELLPVGANQPVAADFRVISATHQDLRAKIAQESFRHDLYFRLVTFEIHLPPLCERAEDIPELVDYFLTRFAAQLGVPRTAISPDALQALTHRTWPGNVRELRNAVEHAMILARGGAILPEHFPPPAPPARDAAATRETAILEAVRRWAEAELGADDPGGDLHPRLLQLVEAPLIQAAVAHYGGQYLAAARRLGLHRTTLRKKFEQLEGGGEPLERGGS